MNKNAVILLVFAVILVGGMALAGGVAYKLISRTNAATVSVTPFTRDAATDASEIVRVFRAGEPLYVSGAPESPGRDQAVAEIQALVDETVRAAKENDRPAAAATWHVQGNVDAIKKTAQQLGLKKAQLDRLNSNLMWGIEIDDTYIDEVGIWHDVTTRGIVFINGLNEAMVYTQHRSEDEAIDKHRWWVVRSDVGWRYYDDQDIDWRLRDTELNAIHFADMRYGDDQAVWGREWSRYLKAADLDAAGKTDEALKLFRQVTTPNLPRRLQPYVFLQIAWLEVRQGDGEAALKTIERAGKLTNHVPDYHRVIARAHQLQGNPAEAVAAAEKFVGLVGDDWTAYVIMAWAHETEGNMHAACEAVLNALRCLPGDVDLLGRLAEDLTDDAPAAHVKPLRDVAVDDTRRDALFAALYQSGQMTGYRRLIDIAVDAGVSEDALRLERASVAYWQDGNANAALKLLEPLVNDSPESEARREAITELWVWVKIDLDDPLDAYDRAPSKATAFSEIADYLSWQEEPGKIAAFEELVSRHRAAMPDAPDLPYYTAELHTLQGNHGQAIAIHRELLAKAEDDDARNNAVSSLVFAMVKGGEAVQAYNEFASPENYVFSQVCNLLLQDVRANEPRLIEVIKLRRAAMPDDPMAWYFDGMRHHYAERFDSAEVALKKGQDMAAEEYDRMLLSRTRVENFYRAGTPYEAYDKVDNSADVFQQLVMLFQGDDNPKGVITLTDHWLESHPADATALLYRAASFKDLGDYRDAAQASTDAAAALGTDEDTASLRDWQERLDIVIDAHLKQADDAIARAKQRHAAKDDALTLAKVYVILDRPEQAIPLLEKSVNYYGTALVYADADFARLRSDPVYDAFRTKYPPPAVEDE